MPADELDPTPSLTEIRKRISTHRASEAPSPPDPRQRAAVALVLHDAGAGAGPEILFIERAVRAGDPWSGQMALPGGRMHPDDPDLAWTARRETDEEVGLALAHPLGRLDDLAGSRNPKLPHIVVSPFVYEIDERPALTLNHEVQSTVWVPVDWILHPDSSVDYEFEHSEFRGAFEAFEYRGYTVWGLTYRMLEMFFEVVGGRMR